jgi:tagaturonate epimerase
MKSLTSFVNALPDTADANRHGVYGPSVSVYGETTVFVAAFQGRDVLVATGPDASRFEGEQVDDNGIRYVISPMNHANAEVLRTMFPHTKPVRVLGRKRTIGLGDRLGIAGHGHLRAVSKTDVHPVLAQQSIRELTMTGRTYEDVLDAATYSVFKAGHKTGFGADGDHLKKPEDIEYALSLGFSMITLDCSDHIRSDAPDPGKTPDPTLEAEYLDKTFSLDGADIRFDGTSLKRASHIYDDAISYTVHVWNTYLKDTRPADFELSIDETGTPTTPTEHFYVANELSKRGVILETLAPRFCGEFQKGIDYIGDIKAFESELDIHAAIARHFGYKLSIHSGSDKFSIFESIGRLTRGNFHVKTAGTNWLEAIRVVAEKDPTLYREVHTYALHMFGEATKSYHVTTDLGKIPSLDALSDDDLPNLFSNDDARQLIHITYGFILNRKDEHGMFVFKDKLFALWNSESETYATRLDTHISKHLGLLLKGASDNKGDL